MMYQASVITPLLLWLLRVVAFIGLAYGIGYLAGYFTSLPIALVAGVIGITFFLYMVWRDKRRAI